MSFRFKKVRLDLDRERDALYNDKRIGCFRQVQSWSMHIAGAFFTRSGAVCFLVKCRSVNRNKNEESEVMYDDEKSGNEKIGDCSQHDYLGINSVTESLCLRAAERRSDRDSLKFLPRRSAAAFYVIRKLCL